MTDGAMLLLEERQIFSKQDCPDMRVIEAGDRALRIASLERVLGSEDRVAWASTRRENLAHVIQILAPGVAGAHGQLLEQVVGAELQLQCMIIREGAIAADAHYTIAAIDPAHVSSNCVGRT